MNKRHLALTFFLLQLTVYTVFAQWEQLQYDQQHSNLPQWVELMYSSDATAGEVVEAYEQYYKSNPFVKNKYTQYYKRWLRGFSRDLSSHRMSEGELQAYRRAESDYLERSAALQQLRGPSSAWQCVGPFDFDKEAASTSYACGAAHVYTVEKSMSNPDILYAGTATAGIWKSTDRGKNWFLVTEDLMVTSIRALEIDHTNPDIAYFGANNDLYKTTDGGLTWNTIGDPTFAGMDHNVKDIVMHPTFSNVLLLGSDEGLFRTIDGGANWTQLLLGEFQEFEFHPTNPSIVYAVQQTGNFTRFWKSTDDGLNFVAKLTGWPSPSGSEEQKRTEIAVTAADPGRVYALATGAANGGSGLYGIYVSVDTGETWTRSCCGPQPAGVPDAATNQNLMGWSDVGDDDGGQYYYDLALEASQTNPDSIFVAGVNLWYSGDAGASFTCPSKWSHSGKPNYVHADIHDIRYVGNELWIACDGGIFMSENGGGLFERKMLGIAGTDFWGFGAGFQDGEVMLGGTYHNGTLLKDGDVYINGWLSTDGGDNYRGFVNPGKERTVYSDYNKKELSGDRTVDIPTFSFAKKPNASYTIGASSNLAFHPNCYNIIYSAEDAIIWKTEDDGISWESVADFGTNLVTSLEVAWSDPNVIYAAMYPSWWGTKSVKRSDDAGATWTDITPPASLVGGDDWVPYDLTVDSDNPNTLWLARTSQYDGSPNLNNNQVYKSTDGGANWINYTTADLDGEYITNIVHHRGSDGGVYVGTRRAVYYRNNSMSNWALFNNNLPARTVSVQLVPYYRGGKLRNGTNRSVYEVDFYEDVAPHAQISVDKFVSRCVRDTFYFVDHSSADNDATYLWEFQGGTPATSTDRNPKVVYSSDGFYSVTLTVTDSFGTDSQILTDLVTVANECGVDSIPGYAMDLQAQDDFVRVPALGLTTNEITFSAWVKPNGIQDDYASVFMHADVGAGLNFKSNNQLGYHWPGGAWSWDSGLTVPQDEWSHLAMVVTPDSVRLYLNGVGATHITSPQPVDFETFETFIGNYHDWNSRTVRGLIDEACIWNRALSQEEIRNHQHLTKYPANDPDLLAYYQFNEVAGTALDKIGTKHAYFNGGAVRSTSSAPVGGGTSHRMAVTTAGAKDFADADLEITFPATGVYPEGEIVVSRINVSPDQIPSNSLVSGGYWVVNNYGANGTFGAIDQLAFGAEGLPNEAVDSANLFELYMRMDRADGATWGSSIDNGDLVTVSPEGIISFSTGLNLTSFGQLMIGGGLTVPLSVKEPVQLLPEAILVYPNPAESGGIINLKTELEGPITLILYSSGGKEIQRSVLQDGNGSIHLKDGLPAGIYGYRAQSDSYIKNGLLILE